MAVGSLVRIPGIASYVVLGTVATPVADDAVWVLDSIVRDSKGWLWIMQVS